MLFPPFTSVSEQSIGRPSHFGRTNDRCADRVDFEAYNIVFGYTGLLSFGHAAFFGLGAYGCGIAIARYGLPWPLALGAGVLLAGVGAVLIGGLSIRRRGIYFAMVTLALAQLVYYIFYQAEPITGGENGLRGVDVRTIAPGPVALAMAWGWGGAWACRPRVSPTVSSGRSRSPWPSPAGPGCSSSTSPPRA